MSFYAYMLRCADGSYYLGHSDDLEARLSAHRDGLIPGYTSSRRPVVLVWYEAFSTREEALHHERQIKGWSLAKKQALIRGDWAELQRLARSRGSTSSPRMNPNEPVRPEDVLRQAQDER